MANCTGLFPWLHQGRFTAPSIVPGARVLIQRINSIFIPKTTTTKGAWIKVFLEILFNLHLMMSIGFVKNNRLSISTNHFKLFNVFLVLIAFSDFMASKVCKDKNTPWRQWFEPVDVIDFLPDMTSVWNNWE